MIRFFKYLEVDIKFLSIIIESFESAVFNNGQVLVKLNTRQAGNIELVLTDVAGNVVQHMPAANYAMGKTDKVFTTNGLAPGTYYVHAVHNHRWEHLQEVEVR